MLLKKCIKTITWPCFQLFLRRQNRKLLFRMLALCMVMLFYYQMNVTVESSLNSFISHNKGMCRNSKADDEDLHYLIQETHRILKEHNVDPFLCYGSLWGALRVNNPLPWDYDFDIGVLYEDIQHIEFNQLRKDFATAGIQLFYQYYFGNYKVKLGNMSGDIMIFVRKNGMAQRIGIESWLLSPHYSRFHTFPLRLIEKPLPKLKFAGIDHSVPREGIEMQKYLYPNSWWRVIKPKGCAFEETALQDPNPV